MKKLTQKVIDAGLVDDNTLRLMQMWGSPAEVSKDDVRCTLTDLVDGIAELLDEEVPEIRESALELENLFDKRSTTVSFYTAQEDKLIKTRYVWDRSHRLVFKKFTSLKAKNLVEHGSLVDPVDIIARPGNVVETHDGYHHEIVSAEVRYLGDDPVYVVCEVEPKDA